jgi:hypothetical protein
VCTTPWLEYLLPDLPSFPIKIDLVDHRFFIKMITQIGEKTLLEHQKVAVEWMMDRETDPYKRNGGLLCDDARPKGSESVPVATSGAIGSTLN